MYKVCMFGHRAGDFHHMDDSTLFNKINETIDVLKFQYKNQLILQVDGETGCGLKIMNSATSLGVKYHISLPCPVEMFGEDFTSEQLAQLLINYNNSSGCFIVSSKKTEENVKLRNQHMIDTCNFVVVFWEGRKQGRTFDLIKYALSTNKIVLNALEDLKMISNIDLKKKRV